RGSSDLQAEEASLSSLSLLGLTSDISARNWSTVPIKRSIFPLDSGENGAVVVCLMLSLVQAIRNHFETKIFPLSTYTLSGIPRFKMAFRKQSSRTGNFWSRENW